MECILKLGKTKFCNETIRFVIWFLLLSFCISGAGCGLIPPIGILGERRYHPSFHYVALIQPLPENHGSWSKEEVDIVVDAIVVAAMRHGLKKKWGKEGLVLSTKDFELSLNAYFRYVKDGIEHTSRSLIGKPNIQKSKGTIELYIELFSWELPITDSNRLLVDGIWGEVLGPLRNKFANRMEDPKIYKLEP